MPRQKKHVVMRLKGVRLAGTSAFMGCTKLIEVERLSRRGEGEFRACVGVAHQVGAEVFAIEPKRDTHAWRHSVHVRYEVHRSARPWLHPRFNRSPICSCFNFNAKVASGLRLIQTSDDVASFWATEQDKLDLLKQRKNIFDLTETYNLEEAMKAKKVEAYGFTLDAENMIQVPAPVATKYVY
ncbi:hypothetical protein FRC06_001551 [Ceratobasidium sp. 370]|nr:hypothetical protein FRC06_001551 [Ceratobasidium sp. 370]